MYTEKKPQYQTLVAQTHRPFTSHTHPLHTLSQPNTSVHRNTPGTNHTPTNPLYPFIKKIAHTERNLISKPHALTHIQNTPHQTYIEG